MRRRPCRNRNDHGGLQPGSKAVKPQVKIRGGNNDCQQNTYLHARTHFITHSPLKNVIKVLLK